MPSFVRRRHPPAPLASRSGTPVIATILMVLGGVIAFAYGIYAGLGRYRQSPEEIDRALTEPGRRRKVTRHFTPLDLMAKMTGVPTQRDRRNPFRFDEEEADGGGPSAGRRRTDERGATSGRKGSDEEGRDAARAGEDEGSEEE